MQGHAAYRQVISFRTTPGKDDLRSVTAQQLRDLLTSRFNGAAGELPVAMRTGWIAKVHLEIGKHYFNHQRINRRGGVIIDRKSTRLNSSHLVISYAVFCLK